MSANCLNNDEQFGYKKHHSTETMMLGIVNDILTGFDEPESSHIAFKYD